MNKYECEQYQPPAPVARVLVRNPVTDQAVGDVPMLIDSGADVTLLPADIVAHLGLSIEGEQMLVGYDGERKGAPIVSATLVWGKYTFRGQYVVGPYEIGVLGREVLNNLRLTLNGPKLAWALDC